MDQQELKMINPKNTYWLLRPFVWLWNLIAYIVMLTGRVVAVVMGLVLMIVGIILTLTVVGAIAGIPLLIIGLLLVVRGLW
ncbi:MAG: hypothetical protein A2136_02475 [Chloroflexi bacterium RBG_16_54_11]|nr:MAG: hypothetical protein A2136_02475 [Chloroflexi bacterium RBG_16_54_11]